MTHEKQSIQKQVEELQDIAKADVRLSHDRKMYCPHGCDIRNQNNYRPIAELQLVLMYNAATTIGTLFNELEEANGNEITNKSILVANLDRDKEGKETLNQLIVIAVNGLHWRNKEIKSLQSQVSKMREVIAHHIAIEHKRGHSDYADSIATLKALSTPSPKPEQQEKKEQ